MKIAVIDCAVSGHRETYYKQFTRTWKSMGHEVHLIAPDGSGIDPSVPFYSIQSRPLLPLPIRKPVKKKITVLRNALIRLRNLSRLKRQLKGIQPDLVFFACLDDLLPTVSTPSLLDWLLPYKWSGLLVQSVLPAYKPGMPDVRPALRNKNCIGIGVLNEYSAQALEPFQKHILLFPDFIDLSVPDTSYSLYKEVMAKAAGRKIISLLGSINPRKGVGLLLKTIPLLPEDKYFFLIAGHPSLDEQQKAELLTFETGHSNCLFSLKKIPGEADFNALVAASDLIFAVYRQFTGSSNMLTKAAAFRKPILVSRNYCMGKRVNAYHTGEAIDETDETACCEAIQKLCCQNNSIEAGKFDRYASDHAVEKLTGQFNILLKHLL